MSFKALVVRDAPQRASVESVRRDDLPEHGNVLVKVDWSSINFKDALAVTGKGRSSDPTFLLCRV